MGVYESVMGAFEALISFLHGLVDPLPLIGGAAAWGWAIVLLTVVVRLVMIPLAVKQFTSMRAMQGLQPEIKKIQEKYKVDRSLMRSDPEKFREQRSKQQQAMMDLYQKHGVNPMASCLPLLLQLPIFFLVFRLLFEEQRLDGQIHEAGFYFVQSLGATPGSSQAGAGSLLLVVLMGVTMYFTQRQMMASNPTAMSGPQANIQKAMLYIMPVMLTAISFTLPVGLLLYWITTNVWTMGQQTLMLRTIEGRSEASSTAS